MNSSNKRNRKSFQYSVAALAAGALLFAGALPLLAQQPTGVAPPGSSPGGQTYPVWAGAWWQWFMQLPLTNSAGVVHPGIDAGQAAFDVTEGQTGDVWFLAAPFGTVTRSATIPSGKSLFFALLNAEQSSLEDPTCTTASCQASTATFLANHIVELSCEIDGVPVAHLSVCSPAPCSFRFINPQVTFTAPTPWIFGSTGGTGTSVGDGYYIFLNPLSAGQHTIHYGGAFSFTKQADGFRLFLRLEMTYHITVQ
jgi:hypothetical protein